jgi:hypothetical protein
MHKVAEEEIFILFAKTIFMVNLLHFFKSSDMVCSASVEEVSEEKQNLQIKLWRISRL